MILCIEKVYETYLRFLSKLIFPTKSCMNDKKYYIRVYRKLSKEIRIIAGLKRDDVISLLIFNFAFKKAIMSVQRVNYVWDFDTSKIVLNIIGIDKENIMKNLMPLINEAKTIGLTIND